MAFPFGVGTNHSVPYNLDQFVSCVLAGGLCAWDFLIFQLNLGIILNHSCQKPDLSGLGTEVCTMVPQGVYVQLAGPLEGFFFFLVGFCSWGWIKALKRGYLGPCGGSF